MRFDFDSRIDSNPYLEQTQRTNKNKWFNAIITSGKRKFKNFFGSVTQTNNRGWELDSNRCVLMKGRKRSVVFDVFDPEIYHCNWTNYGMAVVWLCNTCLLSKNSRSSPRIHAKKKFRYKGYVMTPETIFTWLCLNSRKMWR